MAIIDPITYSSIELKTKEGVPIFIRQAFDLEVFNNIGFPTRVDNIMALRPLVDTMQEGRFRAYIEELNGFSEFDVGLLVEAIKRHFAFQRKYFPHEMMILPLDTMASGLLVSKKLFYFVGSAKNILEIGPGVCSTAFFLQNYINKLESIAYIEACPSFYILQSILLEHLYGQNFQEHAHNKVDEMRDWANLGINLPRESLGTSLNSQINSSGGVHGAKIEHYPWFRIPSLVEKPIKYDLVLANACLNEISLSALNIYLELITKNILKIGGYLFYQCPGLNHDGRDIVQILGKFGFKLLFASGINSDFNLGNGEFLKWRTPTPTALFEFTGDQVHVDESKSIAFSRGLAPHCDQVCFERLKLLKSSQAENLSYEEVRRVLNKALK